MTHVTLPPKVILEVVEGRGLTHITVKVDERDPADAGLALLRRLLPVAQEADAVSLGTHAQQEPAR